MVTVVECDQDIGKEYCEVCGKLFTVNEEQFNGVCKQCRDEGYADSEDTWGVEAYENELICDPN
jgi:hypothetical protein